MIGIIGAFQSTKRSGTSKRLKVVRNVSRDFENRWIFEMFAETFVGKISSGTDARRIKFSKMWVKLAKSSYFSEILLNSASFATGNHGRTGRFESASYCCCSFARAMIVIKIFCNLILRLKYNFSRSH